MCHLDWVTVYRYLVKHYFWIRLILKFVVLNKVDYNS